MDFHDYESLVAQIDIGKRLPTAVYVHKSAQEALPSRLVKLIERVSSGLKIANQNWNILKFSKRDFRVSLLSYPTFEQEPYPPLNHSWTIDLAKLSVREADYSTSDSPPILHRRETFLATNHPQRTTFEGFTAEGEAIGLYKNTRIIGTKLGWERLIRRKGYYLDKEGHLQPLSDKPNPAPNNPFKGQIDRHKTALTRDKLSVPLFLIAQRGYLNGNYSILDYGCGKGDDLRELEEHGIDCIGWDPVYRPEVEIEPCDIVNLGYVINVIEDKDERKETLITAYSYCDKFLIVSAMLGNERIYERFKPYRDGVITARNTFQKYYMQGELSHFIESALAESAIALAPGIFAIFKDKAEEQSYLLERQRTRHQWRQITTKVPQQPSRKFSKSTFEKNKELLEDFWRTCLDLGRLASEEEFEFTDSIKQAVGSISKALTLCKEYFDEEQYRKAAKERRNDLLVYFSLSFFNKRRETFARMPKGLQLDIKTFFGNYTTARKLGNEILFSVSDTDVIYDACVESHHTLPASELNGQHDLIFHKDFLNQCPVELRVYIGCATQLYGELDSVSLVKAHILSGKVTLMVFDDWEKEIPLLTERIKIKMRDQEIDFFDYVGDYEPPPLLNKGAFHVPRE